MSSGAVRIAGHDLARPGRGQARARVLPDEPRLFDYLTVRQHLAFVARIYGVEGHEALAAPLLEELELAEKADVLPWSSPAA
jgi:ABC-2 type transport system ATP-binding protein